MVAWMLEDAVIGVAMGLFENCVGWLIETNMGAGKEDGGKSPELSGMNSEDCSGWKANARNGSKFISGMPAAVFILPGSPKEERSKVKFRSAFTPKYCERHSLACDCPNRDSDANRCWE